MGRGKEFGVLAMILGITIWRKLPHLYCKIVKKTNGKAVHEFDKKEILSGIRKSLHYHDEAETNFRIKRNRINNANFC